MELSDKKFNEILAEHEEEKAKRAAEMPTEKEALQVLQKAYTRLKELGFKDAIYCPKDGTTFDAIDANSTGIHDCFYSGEWPDGRWWIFEEGDQWPSRPILYRKKPESDSINEPEAA